MKKLITFSVVLLITLTGVINSTQAEETSTSDTSTTETSAATYSPIDVTCATTVATDASKALDDYISFLDQYFKINTPSSGQTYEAMQRYRLFVLTISDSFETASTPQGGVSFKSTGDAYSYCSTIKQEYINFGRRLLKIFSLQSGNSKKTYMFIDGLKALNTEMREFSDDFYLLFPAAFKKMDDGMPNFTKACITK